MKAATTIKIIEIKAKVRYSFISSFVRICSFLPDKYLIISYGILNPAAPAMIMAGISKMPCGSTNKMTLRILFLAKYDINPSGEPSRLRFHQQVFEGNGDSLTSSVVSPLFELTLLLLIQHLELNHSSFKDFDITGGVQKFAIRHFKIKFN